MKENVQIEILQTKGVERKIKKNTQNETAEE